MASDKVEYVTTPDVTGLVAKSEILQNFRKFSEIPSSFEKLSKFLKIFDFFRNFRNSSLSTLHQAKDAKVALGDEMVIEFTTIGGLDFFHIDSCIADNAVSDKTSV